MNLFKNFFIFVCGLLLFVINNNQALAAFEDYAISKYGTPNTGFWKHNYYQDESSFVWMTHTGQDFDLGNNSSHVNVTSYGFGKALAKNTNLGSLSIRHLIDNGAYVYTNLLHMHRGSIKLNPGAYIVKNEYLGREGNTGLGYSNLNDGTHLHFEVAGQASSAWVPTATACPGPVYGNSYRTTAYDIGDLTACYRIKSATETNKPYAGQVWYSPSVFARHKELIPYLSRSSSFPSALDYDVYGVSQQPVYGRLRVIGSFQSSSIIVRDFSDRSLVESTKGGLDDQHRFLCGINQNSSVNGIYGNNEYSSGDYLFAAFVKKNNQNRFGFPVKFSVVDEGSIIIDNDQQNADSNPGNDSKSEPAYNAEQSAYNVPGYYLTAALFPGRSGKFAQWKPYTKNIYKIYVHIPEYGATANNVRYLIKYDGVNGVLSNPVDQSLSQNKNGWVQLTTSERSEFDFTEDGYVGLFLGTNNSQSNYAISPSQDVAFDAVKFVQVTNENENETEWTTGAYNNNQDIYKKLSVNGASSLNVNISGKTEQDYDFIYIYDQNNNLIKQLSGSINETFTVSGSYIIARLITDDSYTESGVTISISD